MPLPIIILLERHWDKSPKQVLISALSFLTNSGYNTLCFETPCDQNQQETIASIESTIAFIEKNLAQANQCLAQRGMFYNLPEMDYIELEQLLKNYVSSRYSEEMALWFKELPAHKEKLLLVKQSVERHMKICGIDLESKEYQAMNNGYQGQVNLNRRVSKVYGLSKIRAEKFKTNLLKLQQEGRGIVFVVGHSHYIDLIEEFSKDYPLSEIIFLHPYSSKCLTKSVVDYQLQPYSSHDDLILIEKTIDNKQDVKFFLKQLEHRIQQSLNNVVPIEPTSTCQLLTDKTGLSFEAYVRPGYLVDGHHFFSNKDIMTDTVTKLNNHGVFGFFSSFKNRQSYCVPNINMKEVASKILKMDLSHAP